MGGAQLSTSRGTRPSSAILGPYGLPHTRKGIWICPLPLGADTRHFQLLRAPMKTALDHSISDPDVGVPIKVQSVCILSGLSQPLREAGGPSPTSRLLHSHACHQHTKPGDCSLRLASEPMSPFLDI